MARFSKTLTPAAEAAFLAALRGGALVVAAARQAGVAVSTLYCRRARDEEFGDAWEMAVDASRAAAGRRAPFDAARRQDFLDRVALGFETVAAAAMAGIDKSAVYRRIGRDPDFARRYRAARRRGFDRLDAADREEAAARWRTQQIVPTGTPTADFDEAWTLLRRWERTDGSLGRRRVGHGRLKRSWDFDQAIALVARRLRRIGYPEEAAGEAPRSFDCARDWPRPGRTASKRQ